MKKFTVILASLVLFAGVSFAQTTTPAAPAKAKTEKKAKKAPAKKTTKKAAASTQAAK